MSTCRSCHAEVIWAITAKGKRMPLDVEPSMEGNVILGGGHDGPAANVLAGERLTDAREAGVPLHISHHATCPHGRAWRRQ